MRSRLAGRLIVAAVLVLAVVGLGGQAFASAPEPAHGAAGESEHAAATTEAHAAHGCLDHWTLLDVVPALRHNVCGALGTTYVDGTAVERGMHIPMAILVALVALGLALLARRTLKKRDEAVVPQTRLTPFTFFEILVQKVLGTMTNMMGEKNARQFLPLIAACAVFILFSNLSGVIPGLLPPTDNLNTTFALGSLVFLATHVAGVKAHGPAYFKHFLGPIIKWYALPLMIIMVFIETISHLVRPASLAVRLMGNIFGDHKVLGIFLGFNLVFVPLPIQVLGLLVAVVQTLVFCLLSIVYISMALEHAEEHADGHADAHAEEGREAAAH